jgi:hypothetical protein
VQFVAIYFHRYIEALPRIIHFFTLFNNFLNFYLLFSLLKIKFAKNIIMKFFIDTANLAQIKEAQDLAI